MSKIVCSICSEAYTNDDTVYSTSCGHLYHSTCMQQWMARSRNCPQCRQYDPKSFRIYLQLEAVTVSYADTRNELSAVVRKIDDLEMILAKGFEKLNFVEDEVTKLLDSLLDVRFENAQTPRLAKRRWKKKKCQSLNIFQDELYDQLQAALKLTNELKSISKECSTKLDSLHREYAILKHNSEGRRGQVESTVTETHRNDLFGYAKQLRSYGYKSVYIFRGKVFVKKSRRSECQRIYDRDQVDTLIQSFIQEQFGNDDEDDDSYDSYDY